MEKTKMQHIHHTLSNMIDYFIKLPPTIQQTLTIISFDHTSEKICEKEPINEEFKTNLPSILTQLEPRGMTNIHDALIIATTTIDEYQKQDPSEHNMHIFMSDGQITTGETDKTKLAKCIHNATPLPIQLQTRICWVWSQA